MLKGAERIVGALRRVMDRVSSDPPARDPANRTEIAFAILPLCGFVLAIGVFAVSSPYIRTGFPIDDSWIHQVYARSLAAGHGFAYNEGTQEAGFTSPLWVVVTAPAHWLLPLGGTPLVVFGVKGIGVLLGGLSVFLCFLIARPLIGSPLLAGIAALLFAVEPRLIFAALSGMEPVLVVALWMAVTWAALTRRYFLSVVCLGLMPVARPESAVILPLVLAGIAAAGGRCDGVWRRPATWLCLGLPSVAWAVFCWTVNGRLLPTTFYLKAAPFAVGPQLAGVAWKHLVQQGWGSEPWLWIGMVAFGGWLALRGGRESLFAGAILILAPILYLFGVLSSRFVSLDGYYWTRWVDPAVLILTSSQAMGLCVLLRAPSWMRGIEPIAGGSWPSRWRALPTLLSVVVAIGILLSLARWVASFNERRLRLASDIRAVQLTEIEPALWIRDNAARDAVVGVVDAGAMRYFGERRTIDLMGLNCSQIAFRRVSLREIAPQLDWVVVFPFWLNSSGLADQFVPRMWFRMPQAEYTVCPCPGQEVVVVARQVDDK